MPQTAAPIVPRVRIITARFPGVCADTGERYPAGTALVRGPHGWEISRWEEPADDATACPAGCPCHGDHDAPEPDYNEDFWMLADHYDY